MPPARRIRNPVTMDDLARRHQQIQAELAQIGIALPGSLTSRTTRCQRPGCHCHASPPICTAPTPPGPAKPAPAPSPRPSPPKKPNGSAPTSPPTAACASSSPNSKPSPSNSPRSPHHHRPSHAPNWEMSPLNPGPAPQNPAEHAGQRVLSVAHQGLPTELPVLCRQNCVGDLFLSMARGSDVGSDGRAVLFAGVLAVLLSWRRPAGRGCPAWVSLIGGGAGCCARVSRRGGSRAGWSGAVVPGGRWRSLSRGVRARQARILRMLAAISSSAVKTDWAAMPRTRRRAGWARAWWAVSLA